MKRDPDYVYAALLPFAIVGTGLMMLHWTSQVAPVIFEAVTSPKVRKRMAVRERWERRYGARIGDEGLAVGMVRAR
jgi:hypothetical protein